MQHFVSLFLVVSTSAVDCLEGLVSEMTCVKWDVKPYTLTHSTLVLQPSFSKILSLRSHLSLAEANLEFDHSVFGSHCR